MFLYFKPKFGNNVTDDLIRHATPVLDPFNINILDSSVNCFAFKMKQYERKQNLLRSIEFTLANSKNVVLSVCLSLFSINKLLQFRCCRNES